MRVLSIDIETYSSADLAKSGVYPYVEADDFEILLLGYAFGDERVRVVDLKSGEPMPREVYDALTSQEVIKTAFNANFEITCIEKYFKINLPREQWSCTRVLALSLGLPGSLEEVASYLQLREQKLQEGKELIKYFSRPQKGKRNLPIDNIEKWEKFKEYCIRDVEVERAIRQRLSKYPLAKGEEKIWCLDQRINSRGVKVDTHLLNEALMVAEEYEKSLKNEAAFIMENLNPKSPVQVKKWLRDNEGIDIESLSREGVTEMLEKNLGDKTRRLLEIRQEISKNSIKKYKAMERALCRDGRIRGLFQFYGANRTGRWAGRLVQVQNLPQIRIKDIETARKLIKSGDGEMAGLLYKSLPEVLSQLIRTTFIPSEGNRLIAADFSAIEARILAYIAGEEWRMEVFKTHGKLYEASASRMFSIPIESIQRGDPLRQKGKIAELALGYQGSKGALISMGALKMGLKEDELPGIVSAWRVSNPRIVNLWREVERAAVDALKYRRVSKLHHGIEFALDGGILFIKLPSGRCLSYIKPRLEIDEAFQKPCITYEGALQTKKFGRQKTYGGKLVENIVQAIARDCLCEAMLRLEDSGYKIVMHIHDEVVLDVPKGFGSIDEVLEIMSKPIPWAPGLPLMAEGYEGDYYRKE